MMMLLEGCLLRREAKKSEKVEHSSLEKSDPGRRRMTNKVALGKHVWHLPKRLLAVVERVEKRLWRSRVLRQMKIFVKSEGGKEEERIQAQR